MAQLDIGVPKYTVSTAAYAVQKTPASQISRKILCVEVFQPWIVGSLDQKEPNECQFLLFHMAILGSFGTCSAAIALMLCNVSS